MALALPNLDTRAWEDLVAEGVAMLPRHAPGWTDHNVHDPGITLLELLAYLVEQDLYRANRITERHRRAFLALVGHPPRPPRPARARLAVALAPGTAPLTLPAGTELTAAPGGGAAPLPFVTGAAATLVDARVAAVRMDDPGAALAVGLDGPVPAGTEVSLWIGMAACGRAEQGAKDDEGAVAPPAHHDLVCAWETWDGTGWRPADADDGTRSLTREGIVCLTPAAHVPLAALRAGERPLAHLRCRVVSGRPDEPLAVASAEVNAVVAEQRRAARARLAIRPGTPSGPRPPVAGETVALALRFDGEGALVGIGVDTDPAAPPVTVLEYVAATVAQPGEIALTAVPVHVGTGMTGQRATLPGAPVAGTPVLWSTEPGGARRWDVPVDPSTGAVDFGDGRRGRVPPPGARVLASYATTAAQGGDLAATAAWSLLGTWPGIVDVRAPAGASGGRAAEDVAAAARRAAQELWAHERLAELAPAPGGSLDGLDRARVLARPAPARATTLRDFERIAMGVPGTSVRRARAWAGHDPAGPCRRVPGRVLCVILPGLPRERPEPSPGLLRAVGAALARRRIIGTRIDVVGPSYAEVEVRARLAVLPGHDPAAVRAAATARIRRWLHPLDGGPAGRGWPFGRDVHRAEALALLDGVEGVDHVAALVLSRAGVDEACGTLCLAPTELPSAALVEVETAP